MNSHLWLYLLIFITIMLGVCYLQYNVCMSVRKENNILRNNLNDLRNRTNLYIVNSEVSGVIYIYIRAPDETGRNHRKFILFQNN